MRSANEHEITYLARPNHRHVGAPFGIRRVDRRSHLYVCGKTGTGKSHLLRLMFAQDAARGDGLLLLDPHGDLAAEAVVLVSSFQSSTVVYLNAGDETCPWRFNPLSGVSPERHAFAAASIVETFKKLWPDDWGPRLEHILRNVAFTLLETEGGTFADIPRLLTDRTYRSRLTSNLTNDIVRDFWENEYEKYAPGFRSVAIAPLLNKVGAMLTDPNLRRVLCEEGQMIDPRAVMDGGLVLIANLDKGRIGEGPSALLGSLLLSQFGATALSRSELPEKDRRDFWVYADEFQTFTTLAVATMLAELRKYGIGLTLSHQHLSQLDPAIRDAVFGNVGTLICFRVGAADASFLAREFAPKFSTEDLTGLPRYHLYIRLLIDGQPSQPFSAISLESLEAVPGWHIHDA